MQFKIISIDKQRADFYSEAIDEYLKRISRYCIITEKTINSPLKGNLPAAVVRPKEEELLLKEIGNERNVWLLTERGKMLSSVNFSKKIEDFRMNNEDCIFVIGGSYGFSYNFENQFKNHLSLSGFVLAHRLARVVLLEQIYRAFTIINNEPYHNA